MLQTLKQVYRQLKYFGIWARFGLPWPGRHRGYTRFVILAHGRSGSTMLTEMCGDHSQVTCFSEVFDSNAVNWGARHQRPKAFLGANRRKSDPQGFLRRHVFNWHPKSVQAVGIKVLFHHLFAPGSGLERILADKNDLKVILLDRGDALANLLSILSLKTTERHHVRAEDVRFVLPDVHIDPKEAERFFRLRETNLTLVDKLISEHDVLKIQFEDMRQDRAKVADEICDFLGLARESLTPLVRPLSQQNPRDRILNMDELRRHFRDTRWKDLIDGPIA